MNYLVTKYPQGTFCWADCTSTDVSSTDKFMAGLLGWTVDVMPTGQPDMDYHMYQLDGKDVAAASPMMKQMMDVKIPSSWNNYISVNNVDEMTKKAESLGAKIAMPVMDVLDSGRMSAIMDPQGAAVFLWQPKKHIGAKVVNTVGAMGWNELYTNDLKASEDFYGKLFGWTFETDEGYTIIKNTNGRMNGGIMVITPEMIGMQPKWMTYFTVKSAVETEQKVAELGGKVWMTKKIGPGTIVMIQDPAGANFIGMELDPSMPAEEWVE